MGVHKKILLSIQMRRCFPPMIKQTFLLPLLMALPPCLSLLSHLNRLLKKQDIAMDCGDIPVQESPQNAVVCPGREKQASLMKTNDQSWTPSYQHFSSVVAQVTALRYYPLSDFLHYCPVHVSYPLCYTLISETEGCEK